MTEEWRVVPGWEGFYEISNRGQVKSLPRVTEGRWATPMHFKERIRKAHVVKGGYLRISLSAPGRREKVLIHRAVLVAFVGPCPDGMEALHADNNPANNELRNLTWGTPSENVLAQVRAGTHNMAGRIHCPAGHAYDEANTYINPSTGGRSCRACKIQRRNAA